MVVIVPKFGVTRELNQPATIWVNHGGPLGGIEHQRARVEERDVAHPVHDAPSHQVDGTAASVVKFNPFSVRESGSVVGGIGQDFRHFNIADLAGHELHWKRVHAFGGWVG